MNTYELTFLVNKEEDVKAIETTLESLKGKVANKKAWGKRDLSFPIKKLTDAYYFTWILDIDTKNVAELKKRLNFNEKLVRYLLLNNT